MVVIALPVLYQIHLLDPWPAWAVYHPDNRRASRIRSHTSELTDLWNRVGGGDRGKSPKGFARGGIVYAFANDLILTDESERLLGSPVNPSRRMLIGCCVVIAMRDGFSQQFMIGKSPQYHALPGIFPIGFQDAFRNARAAVHPPSLEFRNGAFSIGVKKSDISKRLLNVLPRRQVQ
ncbi:hypothetical protein [Stratiformator vulcanicus]|uniref:hypothetical protein n=1 Tax=Stratiformator vulcanicus TaxID=2527980 RepID=UPI00119F85B2|nr:hypothetical protein [Stratiformator vulcanicus]